MFKLFRAQNSLRLVGGVSSDKRRNDAAYVDLEKQDYESISTLADLVAEYVPSLTCNSFKPSVVMQKSDLHVSLERIYSTFPSGDIQTILAAVQKTDSPMCSER